MGNLPEHIKDDLLQLEGKSADHVTHALKRMSGRKDGTMVDGLMKMVDAFIKDKQESISSTKKTYGAGGFAAGIVFTGLVAGGAYLYDRKKRKNESQIEAEWIQKIMDEEVELANAENTVMNESTVPEEGGDENAELSLV